MRKFVVTACSITLAAASGLPAAQTDRSSVKKTIEIQASGKVEVPAEMAIIGVTKYVATVPLTLYPPRIERQASVTVTFAIAP